MSDAETYCDPVVTNADVYKTEALDGTPLVASEVAIPCGIIAYSVFNDSFTLSGGLNIESTGIAWPSDLQKYQMSNVSKMWLNVTDERFMNWMRIAALPEFRKLWGRIETNIPAGNYTLTIDNSKRLFQLRIRC